MRPLISFVIVLLFFSCNNESEKNKGKNISSLNMKEQYLFVGTYTKKEGHVDGKGKGIYQLKIQNDTAEIKPTVAFETTNPSYLIISKDKKYLYAVNELGPNDGDSGMVNAYRIDEKTKALTFINQQKTAGFAPCHIEEDATGTLLIVSNYGGVVIVFPIEKNGGLGEATQTINYEGKSVTDRQEAPHPHSTRISSDNKFAFVCDLGTDKIMIYQLDLNDKKMLPTQQGFVKMANGAGPRHFDFHPTKNFAYVVNELNSTVSVLDFEKTTGELKIKQSMSTLPVGFDGFNLCADIHVHPSGKFLYVSNRGHNSLTIFEIDNEDGTLKFVAVQSTDGNFPRNFAIEKNGNFLWVANQNSDNLVQFKIYSDFGLLEKVKEVMVPTPVCIKFLE